MHSLRLRIPPVVTTLIFAAVMAATAFVVPASVAIPYSSPIAVVVASIGVLVALAGVVAFRRQRTTVNPLTPEQSSSLVVAGIYRFSRNPMYLGFLLALGGWCVYLANWVSAVLLPLFVAYMNRFQIQPEEQVLTERFGERFADYRRTVRRWL